MGKLSHFEIVDDEGSSYLVLHFPPIVVRDKLVLGVRRYLWTHVRARFSVLDALGDFGFQPVLAFVRSRSHLVVSILRA